MSARDRILGRLRAAPAGSPAELPDLGVWRAMHPPPADASAAIALFRKNIEAARAEVHDTTTQDWPLLLTKLAVAKGVRTLLFGPNTRHGAQRAAHLSGADPAAPGLVPSSCRYFLHCFAPLPRPASNGLFLCGIVFSACFLHKQSRRDASWDCGDARSPTGTKSRPRPLFSLAALNVHPVPETDGKFRGNCHPFMESSPCA